MDHESRLDELLDQWEALRQRGQEPTPDTLCHDCPELVNEVKQRIERLRRVDGLLYPPALSQAAAGAPGTTREMASERRLGRYRLDALLGQGGFGEVWRSYDPDLRRQVAIKRLRPERLVRSGQVERFQEEARKLAQLRHPNIVPVFDVGQSDGAAFIVSELVEGENLAAVVKHRRFTCEEAVALVAKLADALDHAHDRGVIHRDIKPANILLDERSEPHLADFGIAATLEEANRENGDVSGTIAYMSPEQASAAGGIDGQTDIYSLGVVLYELLTGKRPYTVRRLSDLRDQPAASGPEPPRKFNAAVSATLERVCLKALAREPTDRYDTAKEFGQALLASRRSRRSAVWGGGAIAAAIVAASVAIALLYAGRDANDAVPPPDTSRAGEPEDTAGKAPLDLGRVRFAHEPPKRSLNPKDEPSAVFNGPGRFTLKVPATVWIGGGVQGGLSPLARTGILVEAGQVIDVKASGRWRVGPLKRHLRGPELLQTAIDTTGKPPSQFHTVGEHVEFKVEQAGELFFGISDGAPGDNSGELTVEVEIR